MTLWERIVGAGVTPEMTAGRARYVRLVNVMALVSGLSPLLFTPVALQPGGGVLIPIALGMMVLTHVAIVLNHRRRYWLATVWLGTVILVSIALNALLVFGVASRVHTYLVPSVIVPFLVFPPEHNRSAWVMSLVSGAACIAIDQSGAVGVPTTAALAERPAFVTINLVVLLGIVGAAGWYSRRATLQAEAMAERERERSEELLLNILPEAIANRLKAGEPVIADGHEQVTILFSDIVGFTALADRMSPEELVGLLNELYSAFDDLADELGVEKIKTIGDGYMVAAGLDVRDEAEDAACRVTRLALAMLARTKRFSSDRSLDLGIRIGIHTGAVVAGVIGKRKFAYDIWGDAVNVASRMESNGLRDEIQLSDASRRLVADHFATTRRGEIPIKGKGAMATWLLAPT